MKKLETYLMLSFLFLVAPNAHAEDASEVSVVYLKQNVIKTVEQNGQEYQLWLKRPDQNTAKPFFDVCSGTGLLIAIDNQPYLVTASHVGKKMTPSALIIIKGTDDTPIAITFIDLIAPQTKLNWIIHNQADVAVLPITTTNLEVRRKIAKHFLGIEILVKEESAPDREFDLTILGFPLNLGVEGKFSPISKTSRAASGLLTLPRADTKTKATFFLLEDPSVGGFSGAPVFVKPGTVIKGGAFMYRKGFNYLGIVHGTISDRTGGKFAAVIPSKYVVDTLRQAHETLQQKEKATGQPENPGDKK
ncbi:MAG: serine protease [Deltaproteobacteria bacterium]|nr:serine protease [Deltaproteobacteria bacterium]